MVLYHNLHTTLRKLTFLIENKISLKWLMDLNIKILLVSESNNLKEEVVAFIQTYWRAYHHCSEYLGRLISADPDLAAFALYEDKVVGRLYFHTQCTVCLILRG